MKKKFLKNKAFFSKCSKQRIKEADMDEKIGTEFCYNTLKIVNIIIDFNLIVS